MAQRRMFSLQVVDTDAFLDMPSSAQALYFHLGMRADDDGFISNAKKIMRMVGAAEDDLRLLLAKRFLLSFDSGIIVVKHWKISNYIQKDRYRPTLYKEEKSRLWLKSDGAYTDHFVEGSKPCLATPPPALPDGNTMDTDCIHRLGEDRLGQERLGEVRLGEVNNYISDDGDAHAGANAVREYFDERNMNPGLYFGTTEALLSEVSSITKEIFTRLATRTSTNADVSEVFHAITIYNPNPAPGESERSISQDALDLLLYAFEQAVRAGNPGNWNYINGVLARLSQRGIRTLADAENYDIDHH